jgi:hypothetical protein
VIQVTSGGSATSIGSSYYDLLLNPYGGSVGIGTTAPGASLDIKNNTSINNVAIRTTNASGTILFVPNLGGGGYNNISQPGDQGIIFYGPGNGTGNLVIAPWSSTLAGIRITSAGNVGIGTTSPSYTLDVNGTIRAQSGLIIPAVTSDPSSPVTGQMWLRSDL